MGTSSYTDRDSSKQFSLLMTTNQLFGWTGSETLLLTLIEGLLKVGCQVAVYARHLDTTWASRHIDPSIRFTDDLDNLRHLSFDVAHVQHSACLVDVRATFPRLPILFSSLGILPFLEQPTPFDLGVSRYLAISEEVVSNLMAHGIAEQQIHIVRNLVSSVRFSPRNIINEKPERILVLSNKISGVKMETLRMAARNIDAAIRFVGGVGNTTSQNSLVTAINEADVVVSLGRGVVEAMLCGRVPLVFDLQGGDGLVTPQNLAELQTCNFSGRRHGKDYTVEELVSELRGYRQEYGGQLREMAVAQYGAEQHMPRLLEIYGSMRSNLPQPLLPEPIPQALEFFSAIARDDRQLEKRRQITDHYLLAEIRRIKSSVSWRITAPLRVLGNLFKNLAALVSSSRIR